jgi:hypothetical protein
MAKRRRVLIAAAAMLAAATAVRGGHELAVYPSYYPHEIRIERVPPEQAPGVLRDGKIQAYLGGEARFPGVLPPAIRAVESLGTIVTLRINPASPHASNEKSACAVAATIIRDLAGNSGLVLHPYPVTPFHGDYLYHVDRAEAAKAHLLDMPAAVLQPRLNIRADDRLAGLVRPEWRAPGADWDAALEAVDMAKLVAESTRAIGGWSGPPWVKSGWFYAERILGDAIEDAETKQRAAEMLRRLESGDYRDPVERINLERDLVAELTAGCRKLVVGYTLRQEYFNADFNDGIENIGFDSIAGLNSPMFIRTVKLKNFPWNGWLALGIATRPESAWNPIAGFLDGFGQLLWSAVGDPALLPAPYDSGWMLNRVSDVRSSADR